MPQSVYPSVTVIDTSTALDVQDAEAKFQAERLIEVAERLNRQLGQITNLELEEGDL